MFEGLYVYTDQLRKTKRKNTFHTISLRVFESRFLFNHCPFVAPLDLRSIQMLDVVF